jgi:dynein heavy chain, axonemal
MTSSCELKIIGSLNLNEHYFSFSNFIKTQLDEYNKVPGTVRMNLIMFKEAILHLMRIVRVITQPKGHMLVVGMGGSGRQSLCRLAAFLCEQITYQIEVTNKYHMAEFKEDLKVVYQLCGVKNKQLCFLLSDTQMVEDTFLEVVNNMLGNGQVFNLFKPDELDDIRNKLREKKVQQPIGSNDEVYNYLGDKFIENVHILFCVSPIGPNLSNYVRNFPGLINFTTIDWYKQWPEVALNEVAVKYLANIQLNAPLSGEVAKETMKEHQAEEDRRQTNTAKMCSTMHLNVITGCLDMELQFKRHNYVAPTNFLELLNNYQENLHKKRTEKQAALQKFQNGLLKINETEAKVAVMSEELKVNQEQVTAFQAECDAFIKIIQLQTAEADVAKEQVSEQSKKIAVEEDKCKVMAEQAQGDLDAAMPALRAAIAALDSLNKKDLTEIRSFPSPPVKVERVLEAVMILLLKEPSWVEAKRQLGDQKFLDRLRNFDKNHMSDKVLKKISIYTQDRELEPEKVGVVSIAAKSLILWVRAIEKYGKVWK